MPTFELAMSNKIQVNVCETLARLVSKIIRDLYLSVNSTQGLERDVQYVMFNSKAQGLSFFTTELPKWGKLLDRLIGVYTASKEEMASFSDEEVTIYLDDLPVFPICNSIVADLIRQAELFRPVVTDYDEEEEKDHALEEACRRTQQALARTYRFLRTLFFLCYKLEMAFTKEQLSAASMKFILDDLEVGAWQVSGENQSLIERMRHVVADVMDGFPRTFGMPRHGPGAVATGERAEQKWTFDRVYSALNRRFPAYEFMAGIRSTDWLANVERLIYLKRLPKDDKPTSKVVFVQKDSRGPRTICAEPLGMMFCQQAYADNLVHFLERRSKHRGHINFTSQQVNRDLALKASKDCDLATMDMKDASDLVSRLLVMSVFPQEHWADLDSLRSLYARLPSGEEVRLEKFAPMGSAICFPVESVIFYSACVAALQESGVAKPRVFVYGDDILVPTEHFEVCRKALELLGLKVNTDKSCRFGLFRESCGMDAFMGHPVTPVRVRKQPPSRTNDGAAIEAWVSYSNSLYEIGALQAADYCASVVRKLIPLPIVEEECGYIALVRPCGTWELKDYPGYRWNADLMRPEVKAYALDPVSRPADFDGLPRLLRGLISPVTDGNPDRVVVRGATIMRLRWRPYQRHFVSTLSAKEA